MSLQIPGINQQDPSDSIDVSDEIFGRPFNEALVHQLVTRHLAGARSGTKAQKNRSAVSGGGAKPFRQKGTGRARAGTTRSPLWRTGGVTFAANPRSFDQKLNKKMYKSGVKSIFSELLRQNRLVISNDLVPTSPKTKAFKLQLKGFDKQKLLIVVDELSENLVLASRNIPYVEVSSVESLDPVQLVAAESVIINKGALKQIEERLS